MEPEQVRRLTAWVMESAQAPDESEPERLDVPGDRLPVRRDRG